VIDLAKSPTGRRNTQSPYVLLSRVKDLTVLRFFDRSILDSPVALEDRLNALAEETKKRHPITLT